MKKLYFLGLFFLALAPRLYGLTVELYEVTGNALSSQLRFEAVASNTVHSSAKQYLKIDNPGPLARKVWIYTQNNLWEGAGASVPGESLPLYTLEFGSVQPGGANFAGEAAWSKIGDVSSVKSNPSGFKAVPVAANQTAYVYFGTKISGGLNSANYQTKITVEVIDDSAPVPGVSLPKIYSLSCSRTFLSKPVVFSVRIEHDSPIQSATLYHRYQGEVAYRSAAMTLQPAAVGWTAEFTLPDNQARLGKIQYYYQIRDGAGDSYSGSASAPLEMEVFNEYVNIPLLMVPNGKSALFGSECDSENLGPRLTVSPGSMESPVEVSARRISAVSLPKVNGADSVTAYDFSPHGYMFKNPVTLSLSYRDDDQDGQVDGTSVDVSSLKVFWFDGFSWRNLGGLLDRNSKTVSATISHFSTFALFPSGAITDEEVRPKERIITPNGDNINDFAQFGISGKFLIKIFDVRGKRVRKLEDNNIWNGRDEDGDIVESGVYIFQVDAPQNKVSGTVAVER